MDERQFRTETKKIARSCLTHMVGFMIMPMNKLINGLPGFGKFSAAID